MLYEVIANAEDAKANNMIILLDERDHKDFGGLVSPEFEDQSGPALVIFNSQSRCVSLHFFSLSDPSL